MIALRDETETRRVFLAEVADLAVRADEAGLPLLSVALLQIMRASRQMPQTRTFLVNTGACILDTVESVHEDKRLPVKFDRRREP